MKELFSRIKMDVIISAVCCIAFGFVLILWPIEVTIMTCRFIGGVIAFLGLVKVIGYALNNEQKHGINLPLGLILFFVGIWIFLRPVSIQNLLMIGIGVLLFVHGLEDFKYALEIKNSGYDRWYWILILSLLCMLFGAACIIDCFGVISVTLGFVGAALIYDGITDLWIVFRMVKAAKEIKREVAAFQMADEEIIDAEVITKEETGERERD